MKKIYFTTLILLINLSLFAQLREFQKLFPPKTNLFGETINSKDLFLGDPIKLINCRDKLIIIDRGSDFLVNILNSKDFSIYNQFGKIGRGPGEIQYFGDAWVNEQENTIDIFDLRNKKIYSVLLEKDIQSESTITTTIEPKLNGFTTLIISRIVEVGRKFYVSSGLLEKGMFVLTSKENRNSISYSDFGIYGNDFKKLTNVQRCMAIQGGFCIQPGTRKFAYITGSIANSVQIHELTTNNSFQIVNHFILNSYLPEIVNNTPAIDSRKPFGFLSWCCNSEKIFVLYSEKTFKESGSEAAMSNIILTFDWNANPLEIIQLDRDILKIGYLTDNSLIGISLEDEPKLVKFKLEIR